MEELGKEDPAETRKEEGVATGANTPVLVKIRRIEENNKEAPASRKVQQHPGQKGSPMGSPCGLPRFKQPTLGSFLELRGGLEGSLRQAGDHRTSGAPAKGTGGRDLSARVKVTTKGRVGEGARRGGRICGAKCVPGPMDAFVERKTVPQDLREATLTEHRKRQRKKSLDKEGSPEEGAEGRSIKEEEQ